MKKPFHFILLLLSGCIPMETRYLTEKYIKTRIESHTTGEFSTIKLYSVYQSSPAYSSYIEFTGYKYGEKRGLIIGADKYYLDREKFKGDNTIFADVSYIELTLTECQSIIDNYQTLVDKTNQSNPLTNEEIYHDYTVNNDLFISYRASVSDYPELDANLWIKGQKFILNTDLMVKKLIKFMAYAKN